MSHVVAEIAGCLFELLFPTPFQYLGHGLLYVFTLGSVKADDDTAVIVAIVFLLLVGLGIWLVV